MILTELTDLVRTRRTEATWRGESTDKRLRFFSDWPLSCTTNFVRERLWLGVLVRVSLGRGRLRRFREAGMGTDAEVAPMGGGDDDELAWDIDSLLLRLLGSAKVDDAGDMTGSTAGKDWMAMLRWFVERIGPVCYGFTKLLRGQCGPASICQSRTPNWRMQ